MAATTLDQLEDVLAEEIAWRRTELHSLLSEIRSARGPAQNALCRAGVALLYAHWEGFTKLSLGLYLKYVARRRLTMDELQYCFVAMALDLQMRRHSSSNIGIEHVKWLLEEGSSRANLSQSGPMNTKSNLNSAVCEELLRSVGISPAAFGTRGKFIDYKLLKARNEIAHGEYLPVRAEDYEDLHTEVLELIETIRRLVIDAAENKRYRRSSLPG